MRVQLHVSASLLLEKLSLILIAYEAGWAPGPVWTLWRTINALSLTGNRTPQLSRIAGTQSLYRLIYPCSVLLLNVGYEK
jgi:hypothetical protein